MNFEQIIAEIKTEKMVAFRFQKEGHSKYRDRVTVYRDGKALFERFCYGEAAGLVFKMWGACKNEEIIWDYDKCAHSQKNETPIRLCEAKGGIAFDNSLAVWQKTDTLKTDPQNGYSFLKMLFER